MASSTDMISTSTDIVSTPVSMGSEEFWANMGKLSKIIVDNREYTQSMEVKFDNRMNSFTDMMMKAGQQLVDCNRKIGDVDTKVSMVNTKVAEIEEKMSRMVTQVDGVRTDSIFSSPNHWLFWQVLPLLFNGSTGHCAWVPVTYTHSDNTERDVVVVSLPMVEHMCCAYFDDVVRNKEEISTILKSGIPRIILDEGKMSMKDFLHIMSKTPFRPYAHGIKKASVTGNNVHRYYIVDSRKWKKLLEDINSHFPDRPRKLPTGFECKKMDLTTMTQRWSIVAHSPGNDSTSNIPSLAGKVLTMKDREGCPAIGIPWWKEAYGSGSRKFFDMPYTEDLHHINSGVYDEESKSVRPFQSVLGSLERSGMLTYEFPDGESSDEESGKRKGVEMERSSKRTKK